MQRWSKVKANGQEGYVNNSYLMDKRSYDEMNSVFANETSRRAVPEPEAKRALLDFFRTRNLVGNMEPLLQKELFGKVRQKEVWQLVAKQKRVTPNTVYYKMIVNPQSKLKDFAFVITHLATQKRRFVLYRFSDTEFVYEEDAPDDGDIMAVNKNGLDDSYRVRYTN